MGNNGFGIIQIPYKLVPNSNESSQKFTTQTSKGISLRQLLYQCSRKREQLILARYATIMIICVVQMALDIVVACIH